jgi:2-polyprenyl-6-hydroxyphenyl methylase/3-demethylubiquinone-9 3-methyltransferase
MGRDAAAAARSMDPAEIAKFAAMADAWWDPQGKFRPLHRLNPARLTYIRDSCAARFNRDAKASRLLAGLKVVDIGCGGGLLCEPLARLGATVSGIDAGTETIAIARSHAAESELAIDYREATAEMLAEAGERFDVVLSMEVVEHVADPASFISACSQLVAPGGLLIVATLNRTAKSFAFAIVGAEYVLRWLPRGTHDWRRFLRPSELAAMVRGQGLTLNNATGIVYSPLGDSWRLSTSDLDVNYMLRFERSAVRA